MDVDSPRNFICHNIHETIIMVLQKLEYRFENCYNRTSVGSFKVNNIDKEALRSFLELPRWIAKELHLV